MTRSELARSLSAQFDGPPGDIGSMIVSGILDAIAAALAAGRRVEIRGFGTFDARYRNPRVGRNPKTGNSVAVGGRYLPRFRPGKVLQERVRTEARVLQGVDIPSPGDRRARGQ